MITCLLCSAFVSDITVEYNSLTEKVKNVMGNCWRHGKVVANYDDFEELNLTEFL